MTKLKSAHSKNKVKYVVFIKIVTFIIFSWICPYNNDEYSLSKSLENGNKVNISLDIRAHRLLARHEYQNELKTRGLQYKVSYNRDNYKLENGKRNNNTFEELKQGRSNQVDEYLKSYKYRYSKKKGLSKLDCYCEKKVLDKIHGLYGVGEKLMKEKKSFKNFFLKKYVIGLILLALISAPSVIYSILFVVGDWWYGVLEICDQNHDSGQDPSCTKYHQSKWDPILQYIRPVLTALTFTIIIIILLFVFYTLIKVVKYERLKSGKDKMSLKEYCRFSKDVFM